MPKNHLKTVGLGIIIIILLVVLIVIFGAIRQPLRLPPIPRHAPWSEPDLARVQPWLTFDFINFVFRLPPTYLASKLPAPDRRYPNLSIERYADRNNLNHAQFLNAIKINIGNYLIQEKTSFNNTATATNSVNSFDKTRDKSPQI